MTSRSRILGHHPGRHLASRVTATREEDAASLAIAASAWVVSDPAAWQAFSAWARTLDPGAAGGGAGELPQLAAEARGLLKIIVRRFR